MNPSAHTPSAGLPALSDPRWRNVALWGGLAFCFLFTGLIWATADRLVAFVKPEDQGPFWYYWILQDPSLGTRALAWGSYMLHQVFGWGLIAWAQRHVNKYTPGLHAVNVVALLGNAAFILWHYVHGHIWYDKLAQDTSIFSSQGSVILMLVWILLMENGRRGMFFGLRMPIGRQVLAFAKKYHGYVFSWATVYTFWYHPVENTQGHLVGFLYMFMLMLQGSLFFTRLHVNRWWMVVQEVAVLFHGGLVAYYQGVGFWPIFVWGFAGMFIITQMHGLGLSRLWRAAIIVVYGLGVTFTYSHFGFDKVSQVTRIPMIEYLCVLVLAILIWVPLKLRDVIRSRRGTPPTPAAG